MELPAVIFSLVVFISTAWMTTIAYGPMPFWDAWEVVRIEDSWGKLWSLHNEHMIMFPRIFYGLDTLLASGTGVFSVAVIWLFQITSCILLIDLAKAPRMPAIALSVSLMFWARHLENLSWSFQVGFVGVSLIAISTMWLINFGTYTALVMALIVGGTAPYWSLNGLLVPMIAAVLCLVDKKIFFSCLFGLATAVGVMAYISLGFKTGNGGSEFHLLKAPLVYANILIQPFIEIFAISISPLDTRVMLLSLIGAIAVHGCALYALVTSIRNRDRPSLTLLAIATFGLGSCLMVALGRNEGYGGPAYRYALFSVVALLPIALITFRKSSETCKPSIFAVIVSGVLALNAVVWYPFAVHRGNIEVEAIRAIKKNPNNPESYRLLYPAPEALNDRIKAMQARQLGMFRGAEPDLGR
ncbi:hypothetical protein [Rhizobium sp. 57MFTsu3.2]|uniref:hypothetical protein n=1 Tax=Rhizobium sp. 57MFTsu3.2 TaxID=1048681 RepID=UPI00146B5992|nr:hypothetical protein [Rhizobium sp. 57MFTsu3.2]